MISDNVRGFLDANVIGVLGTLRSDAGVRQSAVYYAHRKWKAFFARQERNPAYLSDGDVITARIRTGDGLLDLGEQRTPVASSAVAARKELVR
jgi:hypothetical protein